MKQRICKVKGCDRKHYAKDYCFLHYYRKKTGRQVIKYCLFCKKELSISHWKFCNVRCQNKYKYQNNKEYYKNINVHIPTLGSRDGGNTCYTNGVTQEIKDSGFVAKEKERILKDCIKNPRKYLSDDIDNEE